MYQLTLLIPAIHTSFDFLTWASSLLSAAFGFYISTYATKRKEKTQIKNFGEHFEYELKSLEDDIRKQYVALRNYRESIEKKQSSPLHLFLSYKLETILSFNRVAIVKYMNKKYEDPFGFVNRAYSNLSILDEDYKTLNRLSDKYRKSMNALNNEYHEANRSIHMEILKYRRSMSDEELILQAPLMHFEKLYNEYFANKETTVHYVLSLRETYHTELFKPIFSFAKPEFYNKINLYALDTWKLTNDMLNKHKSYIYDLSKIEGSLQRIYKRIYKKEMEIADLENTDFFVVD